MLGRELGLDPSKAHVVGALDRSVNLFMGA
jgi:hypothetical protein